MTAWRAICTKPLHEPVAYRALVNIGVPAFFPRMLVRRRHIPYFRGYIFADIANVSIRRVLTRKGVLGIVGTVPIPEKTMSELRSRADPAGLVPNPGPQQGEQFRLRTLANLLAVVENVDSARDSVLVSIQMFGDLRTISIPLTRFETLTIP